MSAARSATKRQVAAAKRDLALVAAMRMVDAEEDVCETGECVAAFRENTLEAIREWVDAERASGML